MPLGDSLNSSNGNVVLERFEMFAPDMKKTALHVSEPASREPLASDKNTDIFKADLALHKVQFKKDSKPGVYQFGLTSKPNFYTAYIDTKGRERLKLKPKDEIDDIKTVRAAFKYEGFAKSFVLLGDTWQAPEPLGHGLEIIPTTDMSNLQVGDMVEVKVLFYDKPISVSHDSVEQITAYSPGFGQGEGFTLQSLIFDGMAQIRVQTPGQWQIGVYHKGTVTKDGPLKDLYGKADNVLHGASLTFHVK